MLPDELKNKLQQALATTETYRQTAIKSGIRSNPGTVIGLGCLFSLLFAFIGFTIITAVGGLGALYAFLFFGVPLGLAGSFFLAHRFFAQKKAGPPPQEDYGIYHKKWINNLLLPFLRLQYDGKLQVSAKPLFLHKIVNARLRLFFNDFSHIYSGGVFAENPIATIKADFVSIHDKANSQAALRFSGMVISLPFLQILPQNSLKVVPHYFVVGNKKRLDGLPLVTDGLELKSGFEEHFLVYSDSELLAEDFSYTPLFDFMYQLQQEQYPFVALTAHDHQVLLWIGLQNNGFLPDVKNDPWQSIKFDFWDEINQLIHQCQKIAQDRAEGN